MTDRDNDYEEHSVIDGVDDSVVADSQSMAGPPAKWTRRGWSRILGK